MYTGDALDHIYTEVMTDGDGSSPMNSQQSTLRSLNDLAPCFRSLYPSFKSRLRVALLWRMDVLVVVVGISMWFSRTVSMWLTIPMPIWYGLSGIADSGRKVTMMEVVAAPTGTGKTVVMELSMLRLFSHNIDGNGIYRPKPGQMKVIYIAPTRSLVQERVRDGTNARYVGSHVC